MDYLFKLKPYFLVIKPSVADLKIRYIAELIKYKKFK